MSTKPAPGCGGKRTSPNYDDIFWTAINRCPSSPPAAYCSCYESAARESVNRSWGNRIKPGEIFVGRGNAGNNPSDTFGYPTQTDVTKDYPYEILGTISRANQKANIFTKSFDPKQRKIIILLIAGFLIFLAITNAE